MEIVYNDWFSKEIIEYLLSQEGIEKVEMNPEGDFTKIIVNYNDKVSPYIVEKYIELFAEHDYSLMYSFDKQDNNRTKELVYNVESVCCEYCHMGFIKELFENENIIAVDSNYLLESNKNVEYKIVYKDSYNQKQLLDFIDKIKN